MMDRRSFVSLLAGAALAPARLSARTGAVSLYASTGKDLAVYDVDVERFMLTRRNSVALPAGVQYAWPHASGRYLYVASSDGGPGAAGGIHHASAFRIDPASGDLTPHGDSVPLPSRPIHLTTDIPSANLLIAYNNPSGLTVHRIARDGTLGREVPQPPLDAGIYAHQIRVSANNRVAILVTRGNDASGGRPEDPGALKVFKYNDGSLSPNGSVAPSGGYGFGPRHLDFHPSQPWIYVSLERQNEIWVFRLDGDSVRAEPLFKVPTLSSPQRSRQLAGTVHVHPSGRFVFGVNRADSTIEFRGRRVFNGGENTLAVCSIDPRTGAPALVQHADTRGFHARTFHIDPSGRMLVAANLTPLLVREGESTRAVAANLSVFRIGVDGRLEFVRAYDVDSGAGSLFWSGMVKLR